jgi:uncharacterized protein YceH (UPF0502 family)
MHEFESIEEVQGVLERLSSTEMPFLLQLPRRPGQKEARYAHLLSGAPEINDEEEEDMSLKNQDSLTARVFKLETELAELKEAFDKLMKELM